MEKGKINGDEFQEKTYQCSNEKKQGIISSTFNPKFFICCTSTMTYQTILMSFWQLHVKLEYIQKFEQNAIRNMHYSF